MVHNAWRLFKGNLWFCFLCCYGFLGEGGDLGWRCHVGAFVQGGRRVGCRWHRRRPVGWLLHMFRKTSYSKMQCQNTHPQKTLWNDWKSPISQTITSEPLFTP